MIADILKSLKELQYQTLLLVFGVIFIVLSSCDITTSGIFRSQQPFSPAFLVIGIIFVILSAFFFTKKALEEKNGVDIKEMPKFYYKFYALDGTRNDDNIFQDFKISHSNPKNPNAIQFLWADACHSNAIAGEIIDNSDPPCLRVRFDHKGGYGCNIAIRPKDWRAFSNESKYRYLLFDARIPQEEIERDRELVQDVCIAVRIVNGYFQHWEYAVKAGEYIWFHVNKKEWGEKQIPIKIDLTQKNNWHLFSSDGNSVSQDGNCNFLKGESDPDFSVISAVILKFGEYRSKTAGEPLEGKGVVDIRALHFIKDSNS